MKMLRLFLALLTLGVADFACAAPSAENYLIYFGTIEAPNSLDGIGCVWSLKETSSIPRRYKDSGARYGVQITSVDGKPFSYRTSVELPSSPKTISGDFSSDRSEPSKSQITSQTYTVDGRTTVVPLWFDEGDPLGTYRYHVYVNGQLLKTYDFTVYEPKKTK